MRPASFKRPPAASARRTLPAGFRRPPAAPARKPLPGGVARPPVKLTDRSSARRTPKPSREVGQYNREVVAAITAGDPAGTAKTYDRYAAALYGYSHWILHDSAAAAEALKDTFVIATATLSNLSEPSKLHPWLFALARNECRRRVRPTYAVRPEKGRRSPRVADVTDELTEAGDDLSDATVQFRAVGRSAAAADELSDATVQFQAVGPLSAAGDELSDATVQFRAVGRPAAAADELSDATVQFRAVGPLSAAGDELSDATAQFRAVGRPAAAADELSDATVRFRVISLSADPITPFHVISQPTHGSGHVNLDQGQAELQSLIHSILAGLRPREREVIELSFKHDLGDNDLAIVLGVSQSRAHRPGLTRPRPTGRSPRRTAHRAYRTRGLPGAGGIAGRLGWAADRTDARPGRRAYRGVPDVRPSRMGRNAPRGVFAPVAAGPAARRTAGAGPEPLYLHR